LIDRKRVDTLRILIDSHRTLVASPKLSLIVGELNRITARSRPTGGNGWLLAVLHTTRSLDTTLSEIVRFNNWTVTTPSLGSYLLIFLKNGILKNPEKQRYNTEIVKKRNKFMHEAGAMPTQIEADRILSEMHACLAVVLSRL